MDSPIHATTTTSKPPSPNPNPTHPINHPCPKLYYLLKKGSGQEITRILENVELYIIKKPSVAVSVRSLIYKLINVAYT